ncbi:reverse transcriptase domain-containing protein [Tanacetum coccineum]|uniref:Reverse transcriptase domain-containing protein n=1 Tax=Tanacetum coccineum TaxID=301880 RepID=A0ABQ5E479_9ASTR
MESGVPLGVLTKMFLGCLQRLPSNTNCQGRQRQGDFLYWKWSILLPKDDFWSEKHRGNLPKTGQQGHLITKQGIKANPSKVKVLIGHFHSLNPLKAAHTIKLYSGQLMSRKPFKNEGVHRNIANTYSLNQRRSVGCYRGIIELPRIGEAHINSQPCCKETSKAIKLGEHDIVFKGHNSVKGQILTDFLAETPSIEDKDMETKKPEAANKELKLESTVEAALRRLKESYKKYMMTPTDLMRNLIPWFFKVMKQARMSNNDVTIVKNTWPFSHWGINIVRPLPTDPESLKFFAIAVKHFTKWVEHVEIMNYIEKQLVRSQQGWVDNLPRIMWVHRTMPINSQKETPFTLTYGLEEIITKVTNITSEKKESLTQEMAEIKRNEEKEVALTEDAYNQNKLLRYHDIRNGHSTFSIGDFILLSSHNEGEQKQGPYIISGAYEGGLYKITDAFDYSLIHTVKGYFLSIAN